MNECEYFGVAFDPDPRLIGVPGTYPVPLIALAGGEVGNIVSG